MNPTSDKNRRECALLIAGLLLVIAPYRVSGQPRQAESPSNIECLERLEIPEYPPVRTAGIQGIQTVKVLLSDQATVQSVEQSLQVKSVDVARLVDKFFKESAEKALKNSQFSKTCGGKTITLVFHYEMRGDDRTSSLFAFGPPNHFWIRYGPIYVTP